MRNRNRHQQRGNTDFRAATDRMTDIKDGLGGIAEGFGQIFEAIENMSKAAGSSDDKGTSSFGHEQTFKFGESGATGVFGIKVRMGLDGLETENFGNIRTSDEGPVVEPAREPLVDLFEDEGKTTIVVELPGVAQEEIDVQAQANAIALTTTGKRQYAKTIVLKQSVLPTSLTRRLHNGILELSLDQEGQG